VVFSVHMPGPNSFIVSAKGLISLGNKILFLIFNSSVFPTYPRYATGFSVTLYKILRGVLCKIVWIFVSATYCLLSISYSQTDAKYLDQLIEISNWGTRNESCATVVRAVARLPVTRGGKRVTRSGQLHSEARTWVTWPGFQNKSPKTLFVVVR
jgi:hypothetical protein